MPSKNQFETIEGRKHRDDGAAHKGGSSSDENPRTKSKKYLRTIFLPNSSPVPNFVFDELLAETDIPHSVIRVLLFLLRKTVGWDNRFEELSLTEIQERSGVTRPTAIYGVRVICDCWGLFHKTRGRMGQHSSVFTIGDLSADSFGDRGSLLIGAYGTLCPTPSQLRKQPCTKQLLDSERLKREAEEKGEGISGKQDLLRRSN